MDNTQHYELIGIETTKEERPVADLAADFAEAFLMHKHRGVINCDDYYILFGNDGYASDSRSRREAEIVQEDLAGHKPQLGQSFNGSTWAIVLSDYSRTEYEEEELNRLVWDAWMEACEEAEDFDIHENGRHANG